MGELDGRTFRSYEIIRELGHGGMAVVYLGRQITMDRLVAIKVIATLYSTEDDFRAASIRKRTPSPAWSTPTSCPSSTTARRTSARSW